MTPEEQAAKDQFLEMGRKYRKEIAEKEAPLKERLGDKIVRNAAIENARLVLPGEKRGSLETTLKNPIAKKSGGSVSSASKRADGIAQRGKTRGLMVICGGGYMKGKKK